jgi:DNA-binding response OmpR family regulator
MAAGCDGYLTKPIDTRALPELIAAYMNVNRDLEGTPASHGNAKR